MWRAKCLPIPRMVATNDLHQAIFSTKITAIRRSHHQAMYERHAMSNRDITYQFEISIDSGLA
jgi:hypothetical protein